VRWPGVTPAAGAGAGLSCDALLYNVDWSATLCELVGAPVPEGWDGQSFAAQVKGAAGGGREHLVWNHGLYSVQRAIRTPQHLLVRTYDDFGYRFEPVELYDMEADPYQTRNLAGDEPGRVTEMCAAMQAWVDTERARGGWQVDPLMEILRERSCVS